MLSPTAAGSIINSAGPLISPDTSRLEAKVATPETFNPVVIPANSNPAILVVLLNLATVSVTILSVDATPIRPDPSPLNDVAVMTPVTVAPFGFA